MLARMIIAYVFPECPGHALGSFTRNFRGDMAVSVHGQRDLAMADDLHHDPRGDALSTQEARRSIVSRAVARRRSSHLDRKPILI